eukprot:496048-Amphidinium_carterae.2
MPSRAKKKNAPAARRPIGLHLGIAQQRRVRGCPRGRCCEGLATHLQLKAQWHTLSAQIPLNEQ